MNKPTNNQVSHNKYNPRHQTGPWQVPATSAPNGDGNKRTGRNVCGRPTSITLSTPISFVKFANIDAYSTCQHAINAITAWLQFWETQLTHEVVVLYVTYSTTHQRLVEVQFGRYQKNILQEWSMVKNLSCASCAAWNVFAINSLLRGFLFCKRVTGQELFFPVSYSKPTLAPCGRLLY